MFLSDLVYIDPIGPLESKKVLHCVHLASRYCANVVSNKRYNIQTTRSDCPIASCRGVEQAKSDKVETTGVWNVCEKNVEIWTGASSFAKLTVAGQNIFRGR